MVEQINQTDQQQRKMTSQDQAVMGTSQDALITKFQAQLLGYFKDPFVAPFVTRKKKMLPLINRGTWARVYSIRQVITRFLNLVPVDVPVNIISLGAGFDSTFFWLKQAGDSHFNVGENQPKSCYVEVDFQNVVNQKAKVILQNAEMSAMLPGFTDTNLCNDEYKLIAADVRDGHSILEKLGDDFDKNRPTLVLTECLLIYMSKEDTDQILQWLSDAFNTIAVLNYEMINPQDQFGKVMIENLEDRGIKLLGFQDCPSTEAQNDRFKRIFTKEDCTAQSECYSMVDIYNNKLNNDGERQRIEKLEFFDEYEEWQLLQGHYCLNLGTRGDTLNSLAI